MNEEESKVIEEESKDNKFCINCGAKMSREQKFCSECGGQDKIIKEKKINIKFNKKQVMIILGVIIAIIFSAIFINSSNKKKEQDAIQHAREEYVATIKVFQKKVIQSGANLEKISNKIQTYWHENIYEDKHGDDINDAILMATLDTNTERESVEESDEEILSLYKKLKALPNESEDLSSVLPIVDSLYNSYVDYYNFALEPSGNYNNYVSNHNEKNNEFVTDYRNLDNEIKTNVMIQSTKDSIEQMTEKTTDIMKQYKKLSETVPKDDDGTVTDDNKKIKSFIEEFKKQKQTNIDIKEIKDQQENELFKSDSTVNNAILTVIEANKNFEEMITYSNSYMKSKSDKDLEEFKSAIIGLRANIAMYELSVSELEDSEQNNTTK